MELTESSVTAKMIMAGEDEVVVAAGQAFNIETSPGGAEVLSEQCPAGKKWQVRVNVHITETDA